MVNFSCFINTIIILIIRHFHQLAIRQRYVIIPVVVNILILKVDSNILLMSSDYSSLHQAVQQVAIGVICYEKRDHLG